MEARVKCICPGVPYPGDDTNLSRQCRAEATQEDFLCDHCRAMDCQTVSSDEELFKRRKRLVGF